MAEKRDWNVGINARGLEKDVSEEQARRICTTPGKRSMFIIDAHHGPFLTNEDGSVKMNLIIDSAELVPVEHEARVRTFMRALYLNRPDQYGQEAFEETTPGESDVASAAAGVDALVETDDDGEPTGIWDPGAEAAVPAEETPACPSPGCVLLEDHDGDHSPTAEASDDGNVVAFSGKG